MTAYQAAERTAVATVCEQSAAGLAASSRGFFSAMLGAAVRDVFTANPSICAGTATAEEVGAFVRALTFAVTRLLEDAERIAAMEVGIADPAEPHALITPSEDRGVVVPAPYGPDPAFAP